MGGGKQVPVTWYPPRPIDAPWPFFSPSTTMGRGRAYRRGHGRGGRGGSKRSGERHGEYTSIEQTNPKFEAYYRDQGIVPAADDDDVVISLIAHRVIGRRNPGHRGTCPSVRFRWPLLQSARRCLGNGLGLGRLHIAWKSANE